MVCESCRARRTGSDLLAFWCIHPERKERDCQRTRYVCRPAASAIGVNCFRQAVGDSATHAIGSVA